MLDVADSAADLDDADRVVLPSQVDRAVAELEAAGARVVAGAGGGVLARARGRDARILIDVA